MSPSLGWLQAFLCTADHLDYGRAAEDLGISANRVQQRVRKLEQWLHKVLILEAPIELDEANGVQFISIAWEVLSRLGAACLGDNFSITGLEDASRTKLISEVRLHDLERFLALAGEGTFKGAADVSRCDVTTMHRTIKDLETATGSKLVSGHGSVQVTDAGEAFKDVALFILKSLNDFRAVIPDDYDPALAEAKNLNSLLNRRKMELQSMAALVENSAKKQRGRVRLNEVQQSSDIITKAIDHLENAFGPSSSPCETEIDESGDTPPSKCKPNEE